MKIQNPSTAKQLIPAYPKKKRTITNNQPFIEVAEFFMKTIQGEGINIGVPSAFLRVQGCTQNCFFCDTEEVRKQGNPYTFGELFKLMEQNGLVEDLKAGHHLVFTGGSPMKQQEAIISFIEVFAVRYGFPPYVEIENECVLMPLPAFEFLVNCWMNSPKLSNSGNPRQLRYQPAVLSELSRYKNSWFKFVVEDETDWQEIQADFLDPGYIRKDQIILMPVGGDIEELEQNRIPVAELAIKHGVRFTDRLHVTLWNTLTGV